jgi:hypothetical protein
MNVQFACFTISFFDAIPAAGADRHTNEPVRARSGGSIGYSRRSLCAVPYDVRKDNPFAKGADDDARSCGAEMAVRKPPLAAMGDFS